MLSDIVRNTRRSAMALARAQAWNRAAIFAERDMIAAERRGDIAAAQQFLAEMQRALVLREVNMKRHETLRATLGA
jgi:2-hydroxychromene-2-carboxylate isomerase